MARIRKLEIRHFRGIQILDWVPSAGINCLIGPGDSGKSTILDAIDLCLGARRNLQLGDADFYRLDVDEPLTISATLGDLDDRLKNLDSYGTYLRGFNSATGATEDEPGDDLETVLTVRLTVQSDLEPTWSLVSDRAVEQGLSRNLAWADRIKIAPARIGVAADYQLSWGRGSVLTRISEEKLELSSALAKAGREARATFGDSAATQLGDVLAAVAATAKELGIPVGATVKAMLDVHAVSFSGGVISLHSEDGVPLRGLGVGSARLLVAGLQRKATAGASVVLLDELEYGLEPHRIIRLLGSLGAKLGEPPLQVFMTTHSPVALAELSGTQVFVTRNVGTMHTVVPVGASDVCQGTIRKAPDAFLARSVIVCEGASEVGLVRGLDQHRVLNGKISISALGVGLVNSGGGDPDRAIERAAMFQAFGYAAALMRDDDKKPDPAAEAAFAGAGGKVLAWRDGRCLEQELFSSLPAAAVEKLVERAVELVGTELVDEQIKSASSNAYDREVILAICRGGTIGQEHRAALGKASVSKEKPWFKSVTRMEDVARDIVGPGLEGSDPPFRTAVEALFDWASNAG
jgi:putative ATP-dependent endonuclease of the OLD family